MIYKTPNEVLLIDNLDIFKQIFVLFCLSGYVSNIARYLPKITLQIALIRKKDRKIYVC